MLFCHRKRNGEGYSCAPFGDGRLLRRCRFDSFCAKGSIPLPGPGRCKYTGQSVRVLPIRIFTVGKKRSRGLQLVVDECIGKLKQYCSVDDVQIRSNPRNASDARAQVDDEDTAIMNLIRSDDWVVMLDEKGQDIGSEQMAELVGDAGNTGASRLSFCIGGPYGHGRQLRERANISIKLSTLVLNHQIALLVLMEQLYRIGSCVRTELFKHVLYGTCEDGAHHKNDVTQTDGGVLLSTEEHEEVAAVVEELLKYCVNEPVKCPLIFGEWDVVSYSRPTSPGGGYRSALGRLFFKTKEMIQDVEVPNTVKQGTLKALDDKWIQVVFEPPELKIGPILEFQYGGQSEVKLQITYIDDKIRLGKGSRGSLFVFQRRS